MKYKNMVSFLLRSGIAVAFLYAAVAAILQPSFWIDFLPFAKSAFPVYIFSIFEIVLALWLFSDKKTYYAAIIASVVLFLIVAANVRFLDVVFRDIAILFASLALVFLYKDEV